MKGTFKLLWDLNHLYVWADVQDTIENKNDMIELFIDDNLGKTTSYQPDDKHYVLKRSGEPVEGVTYSVKKITGGYRIEAEVPITNGALQAKKGFDIRVTDADLAGAVVSWSDITNSQNTDTSKFGNLTLDKAVNVQKAVYGTPVIDGVEDAQWKKAKEISTDIWVQGTSGATGKAKVMWDEGHLYILAHVKDSHLSDASSQDYQQDSIELFLDPNNKRSSTYESDDGQYRINFKSKQSFGSSVYANKLTSAVKLTNDGYIVEAAIDLPDSSKGRVIGFDFQVNNDEDGNGSRDSVAIWNDSSGQSYANTSKFGALKLVKNGSKHGQQKNQHPHHQK